MAVYLREFENHTQYENYINGSGAILPNVSICTIEGDAHYNPIISIENAVITCDSATYNGQTQVATNIVVTLNGSTLVSDIDYTVSNNDGGINAGNYTFTVNGIGNYDGSKNGTFTINKVTPTVVIPVAKVLTYQKGVAQELVTAGSTDFGTMKYSTDGETYSTSVPSKTRASSYIVYYFVEGDSNVNSTEVATVACSINEKPVSATIELSQDTYTYDGSAKEPTVTVKDGGDVIDPSEYTVTYSNNINAGTASVTITDNTAGDYNVSGVTTFTIDKADPVYTAPVATSPTYNGSAQALLNAGSTSDGTIQYSTDESTWSTTIPSQTNANAYTSYWRIVGDSNHNDKASASISTTISPKVVSSPTITLSQTAYTYNATACQPTATVNDGVVTIASSEYTVSYSDNINAGTATCTITDNTGGNYTVNGSTTFTINKAAGSVTTQPTAKSLTYDNTDQALVTAGSGTGTMMYKLGSGSWDTSIPTSKNAGNYTVYYKASASTNYEESASGNVDVSIAKVTPTVVAPTAKVLTYNGSQQELVNAGSTNYGTLKYSTDGSTYSASIPSGTNAASYTVYYRVDGDSNVNDVAAESVQCSINEKQVTATVTLSQTAYTYNGSACQPTPTVKDGSTVIDPSEYSVTYSNNINAGTGTVTISDNAGGDYEVIGSATFTINKADTTYVAPTANNRTYDTTSKALLNAGSVTGGTIQYRTSQSGTYSTTIPSQTNAGEYTTWWKIVGDSNHNDKSPASISTTVSPKTVSSPTITLSQDTYTYANTAFQPAPTVKDGSTTISSGEYTVSYSNNTNVGTATCTITDKSGGNYTVSGSKTFTITCYSATAPTAKNGNWTGSAQALANAGSTSYGTMVYCSTSGGTFTTTIPTGTNAGSYEVWWKVTGNTNVCNTAATKVACTIKQVAMTYAAPKAATRNYSGSAQQIVSGQSATGGAIYFATSSAGASSSTTVPTQTNAGTYSTYWKAVPDSNHSGGTSSWAQVSNCVINKVPGSITTAPVNNNYTYNGTARAVASAGSGTGTMYYRLGTSGSFSTTMPTMTNAGSNTLYYYAAASTNYNQSATGSITVTVQKANISPTVSISNWTYGGTASNPSVAGNSGSGTVTYYYKLSSASSWSTTKPSAAGYYNIRADIAATTNYNSGTCTSNFTINKANSSLSFSVTNITVEKGKTKTNAVTVNAGDGTVTYSSNNTTAITVNNSGIITGVGTGKATITANISEGTNYKTSSASYTAYCAIVTVTAKYNVTSTSSPTKIAHETSSFTSIEIDGVIVSPRTGYTFSTTGEHTVKYYQNKTSIGNSVFSGCTNLKSCTIGSGVTSIDYRAFEACSGLTSIVIPNSVTSIGERAFEACSGLTSIVIPNSVTSISNYIFKDCSSLTSCTIGTGVTSIGQGVFQSCNSLTSVVIPNSVTSINYGAFINCSGLTSCTIGSGVTSINYGAFINCSSLTSITSFRAAAPTIESNTFMDIKTGGTLRVPRGSTGYDVWMGTGNYYLGKYNWTKIEQ